MEIYSAGRDYEMIKPLTSLRFFFALFVFLSHYTVNEQILFPNGAIGVEFFFILSGFIIAYTYELKLVEERISVRTFLVARIARIYPLHCLTFLLVLLFTLRDTLCHGTPFPLLQMFFNIPLLQSFIPITGYYFSFNAVSWSISDELFFYAMFPLLAKIFRNAQKRILLLWAFIVLLVYFSAIFFVPEQYRHAIFYINPLCRIFDFIIGISLFHLWRYLLSHKIKLHIWVQRDKKFLATFIELGVIALFVAMIILSKNIPQVYKYASYYWIPMSLIILVFTQWGGGGVSLNKNFR
jgi:peptidoglycan/LPS O-acetylase OafA/YrhL